MECTPNFWGRLSLTRTVKDIKKKPILQDICQGPVILIKTSCPWGGGRIFFGGNGESLFLEGMVKIFGGNLWSKSFFWEGEALSPQPPQKIRRERNLHSTLHILLGNYIQVSKIIPRKLCFVIRIFLFQLMQII